MVRGSDNRHPHDQVWDMRHVLIIFPTGSGLCQQRYIRSCTSPFMAGGGLV